MKMYPEFMAKAQAQIDEVVGRDRLPEFADVENMPYIQAIVKELFRWQPVTPLGELIAPHFLEIIVTSYYDSGCAYGIGG